MLCRSRAGFVLSLLLALGGCRDRGSSGQDSRPLPTPEPPASATAAAASRPEPTAAPKKPAAASDGAKEASKPKPVAEPAAPPSSSPDTAAPASGGAPSLGAGGSPAALPSVPAVVAPSAACLTRCQGALQGCLAQPVDGGVPGFANLELCKKAFEACQAACR